MITARFSRLCLTWHHQKRFYVISLLLIVAVVALLIVNDKAQATLSALQMSLPNSNTIAAVSNNDTSSSIVRTTYTEEQPSDKHSYHQSSVEYIQSTTVMLRQLSKGRLSGTRSMGRGLGALSTPLAVGNLNEGPPGSNTTTFYLLHRACPGNTGAGALGGERLRVMVVAGTHARELFSSDLCRAWMLYAAGSVARVGNQCLEPDASGRRVAPIDWLFVPVVNPTGRDITTHAKQLLDRNGTVTEGLCHRGNAAGVDLNRNWPNPNKGIPAESPTTVRANIEAGFREDATAAAGGMSEPETLQLDRLIGDFMPHVLLSLHTGSYAILLPYDDVLDVPVNNKINLQLGNWLMSLAPCADPTDKCMMDRGAATMYRAMGTMGDYVYRNERAAFPLTLEVYENKTATDALLRLVSGEQTERALKLCFDKFNPRDSTRQIREWNALWRGLYYMLPEDQSHLEHMLLELLPDVTHAQNGGGNRP